MEATSQNLMRGSRMAGWRAVALAGAVLCLAGDRPAQAQQGVVIEHVPIQAAPANVDIKINLRISAPGRSVVYARVYFKLLSQQTYRYMDLRPAAYGYTATIAGASVKPPIVQYFIMMLLSDQAVTTYPERNPYGQPFEIIVNESKPAKGTPGVPVTPPGVGAQPTAPAQAPPQILDKLQRMESQPTMAQQPDSAAPAQLEFISASGEAQILALSPEPMSNVPASEVVIAASFLSDAGIDSASIRVTLDREDVTDQGEVSPFMVSISPHNLSPGEHRVAITAKDVNGKIVAPLAWRFSVLGAGSYTETEVAVKPSIATGVVYAESRNEKFSGLKLENNNLGANISGSYGAVAYNGQVFFTSLEDKALQPRNRFSFTAGTPWLTVGLGDVNPRFDELILWGQRVRGFSAALRLGSIFNVDFVTGATLRTVAARLGPGNTLLRSGTFERKLLGVRPSFGSGRHFQWGLTMLKVRDQLNSLKPGESSVTPRDNLVMGSDLLIAFDSHRFEFKASAAASLLSKDITNGPLSKEEVEEQFDVNLPFDPASIKKFFILNESTIPLDPRGGGSLAYNLALRLNYFDNYLQLGYKRIGGEYFSLGNTFLRNDVQGFFAYDRIRMFRNRIYLNLGLERYDEHFSEIDDTPKTALNTFSYGLSVFWAQNLPSLSFNMRNYRRDNNVDTLGVSGTLDNRENALTRDFSFSINYDAVVFDLNHTISLNLTSSNRNDEFGSRRLVGVPPGDLNSNVQLISVHTRYNNPLTTTLTYAHNSSNVANGLTTFKYNLLSGRGEYAMLRDKLKLYGGLRSVSASGLSSSSGTTIQSVVDYRQTAFQFGGTYQPAPAHMFTMDFEIIKFANDGGTRNTATNTFTGTASSNDHVIRAHYEFRF